MASRLPSTLPRWKSAHRLSANTIIAGSTLRRNSAQKRPTPAEEVKIVEQMIAQLDAREMDAAEKTKFRDELQQLVEDIRAGRRRLGDAD